MSLKHWAVLAATTAALMGAVGTAQAAFQGRLANGTPSATCTASGANKCAYFFDTTLGITILNNWNIGKGNWSPAAVAGSAQALAASAGFAASGLSGWVLPTGDGFAAAGANNQYLSIWNSVGNSFAGLTNQFNGVQSYLYMSSSDCTGFPCPGYPWIFDPINIGNLQDVDFSLGAWQALAVRPGDLAAAVPEPQTYAMMLMGLGALVLAARKQLRRDFARQGLPDA